MDLRRSQLHFILLLFTYYCSTHITAKGGNGITVQCLPDQAASLLQLKHAFHNPNLSSWQHGTDCCHWEGVGCDMASGQVITLDLSDRNLRSINGLSAALFHLTSLRNLSLSDNDFNQAILPSFGFERLTELLSLELSGTGLAGQIPIGIACLVKLLTLDFSGKWELGWEEEGELRGPTPFNLFPGRTRIPTDNYYHTPNMGMGLIIYFPSLISSQIPPRKFPCPIPQAAKHAVSNVSLSGAIPSRIENLTKLTFLDLSYNRLSGKIPKALFTLPSLQEVVLSSHELCGTLEDIPDPISSFLHDIDLSNNNLAGHIPKSFFELSRLQVLLLDSNHFEGTVELSLLWKLKALDSLSLSNNMLSVIDVEDGYPFSYPHNIRKLELACCNLTKIPIALRTKARCTLIRGRREYYLNLSRNKLSGHIPRSICTQQELEVLDLSYNNFGGRVPSCLIQSSSISILKLTDNHFRGKLPGNIVEGCMLQIIDLNSNRVEGKIPRSLSNCRSLEVLDIGRNQILDTFPSWLGKMSNLRILILRSNQLYGSIGGPAESDATSKHFSSLQIVDLTSNNFSGSLSLKWFDKLETMMVNSTGEGYALGLRGLYYQEILTFKGVDLTFTKILTTFKMIDFSNNAFDGPVPNSVGKLIALHGLNMSNNAFTGRIPSQLGDLVQLESLDLSRNKLSWEIPQDLTSLTYLAVLNLSSNNLTGMIPEGQQFSSFTNSSFEGNEGLSGRPLSKQCNSSGTGTLDSSVSSQDSVGTIVLFVLVGSGFGVGFAVAVVLSVVFQAKRWNCNRFRSTSK
uniref:Phytosulfokine receptor 2 n=1 Tax=Aegilops tauschii TaxID=37682 RepID=M8B4J8_AEGTA